MSEFVTEEEEKDKMYFYGFRLIEGVSSPLFCAKVLCNCVNNETRVIVRMLEINSSCYQVTRAEILLRFTGKSNNSGIK